VQVGINLNLLTVVQQSLATVLISLTVLAMVITAIVTSLLTRRVLAPLATMTRVADQITRADDLSRRIPELGRAMMKLGTLLLVSTRHWNALKPCLPPNSGLLLTSLTNFVPL